MIMRKPSPAHKRNAGAAEQVINDLGQQPPKECREFLQFQEEQRRKRERGDDDFEENLKWQKGMEHKWRDYYTLQEKRFQEEKKKKDEETMHDVFMEE